MSDISVVFSKYVNVFIDKTNNNYVLSRLSVQIFQLIGN